jgi:hypothetical protein
MNKPTVGRIELRSGEWDYSLVKGDESNAGVLELSRSGSLSHFIQVSVPPGADVNTPEQVATLARRARFRRYKDNEGHQWRLQLAATPWQRFLFTRRATLHVRGRGITIDAQLPLGTRSLAEATDDEVEQIVYMSERHHRLRKRGAKRSSTRLSRDTAQAQRRRLLLFACSVLGVAAIALSLLTAAHELRVGEAATVFVGLAGLVVGSAPLVVANSRETRFVDVDRAGDQKLHQRLSQLEDVWTELREKTTRLETAEPTSSTPTLVPLSAPTFASYYEELKNVLQNKAEVADTKASVLLDKGVAYSRLGIVFYVASIIAWQTLAYINGFKQQHIYGIVSCSLLFVFIEFLAAWFLKQYRAFVDTSTYLIKVKSLFDRYMLTYLAQGDDRIKGSPTAPAAKALFQMLQAEIRWPETYLTRDADENFAREFMSSITELAGSIRRQGSSRSRNGTSSPRQPRRRVMAADKP